MQKDKIPARVELDWLDACGISEELYSEDEWPKPIPQQTIGYLLRDDEEVVTICFTRCPDDLTRWRDALSVPRGMVIKLTRLEPTH